MNQCVASPENPYIVIDAKKHWQPYIEFILRWVSKDNFAAGFYSNACSLLQRKHDTQRCVAFFTDIVPIVTSQYVAVVPL